MKFFSVLFVLGICFQAAADYNSDLQLNQKVDRFYVAADESNTLVILISDAYGPRPSRYKVLAENDVQFFQSLKSGTPYSCQFSAKAAECASSAPDARGCGYPYYRYVVQGLNCTVAN